MHGGEQIGREYKHLKRIYHERESRQGSNQYQEKRPEGASVSRDTEAQRPTEKAADAIGVGKATANRAERVVDAIDDLEEAGEQEPVTNSMIQTPPVVGVAKNATQKKENDPRRNRP